MAHPIHAILWRYLGSEQCAFDANASAGWPWEGAATPARYPAEPGDGGEPTQFDDLYPWLEPQS
jgi:hypothetical protein